MSADAAPPSLALHLLEATTSPPVPARISVGCPTIDIEALQGGFSYGRITAVEGFRGTGKTLIALHALTSHLLLHRTAQAAIIDTIGAHSPPRRLQEVMRSRICNEGEGWEDRMERILDRVQIIRVFDIYGVVEAVEELRRDAEAGLEVPVLEGDIAGEVEAKISMAEIADSEDEDEDDYDGGLESSQQPPVPPEDHLRPSNTSPSAGAITFILIDLLTPVVSAEMNVSQTNAHALLHAFSRTLSFFTVRHNVCTVILNSAVLTYKKNNGASDTETAVTEDVSVFADTYGHPALGKSFGWCVDTRVFLSRVPLVKVDVEAGEGDTVGIVEVVQERFGPGKGRWACFDIEDGVELKSAFPES